MAWEANFLPQQQDTTLFGYVLWVCQVSHSQVMPTEGDCNFIRLPRQNDIVQCNVINTLCSSVDRKLSFERGVDVVLFSVVVSDYFILPNKKYQCKLQTFYDETMSLPSGSSATVSTLPLQAPPSIPSIEYANVVLNLKWNQAVQANPLGSHMPLSIVLTFIAPLDDGGSPIMGYICWAKILDSSHLPNGWHRVQTVHQVASDGGILNLTVSAMLPRTSYVFKVSAFNIFGEGPTSEASNRITTGWPEGDIITIQENTRNGTMFRVDTNAQTLTVQGYRQNGHDLQQINLVVEGWRCHWSPRMTVLSEGVWAAPSLVTQNLENAEDLFGRVVLVM